MRKSYPYGIPDGKSLSEKTSKTLKADILLADVPLIDYSDFDKVISQYLKQQDLDDDQGEVFKAVITAFKTISAKHRNISIKKYVGNVKNYYCSHKFQLLEKDKENRRDADIVAAEEVSRGISRGRKRLAEQQPNIKKHQEKTLKTSTPSPLSSSVSSSSYRSTVPSSPSMSRFLNPDTDTAIDINKIRSNLKEEAKTLHDIFARGTVLEPAQFKRMSLGLSSIIDFSDTDQDSQKTLSAQRWGPLYEYFKSIYQTRTYHLPKGLKVTWILLSAFCLQNNSTVKAKQYIRQVMDTKYKSKGPHSESIKILKVFDFMVDLYDENAWIFDDKQKRSEIDFLAVIWNPLLRKMANIHNNIILVKGGECTNPYTQFMKSIMYSNQDKVIGHRIDLRFVANSSDGNDIDVGAFEAANALPSEKKKAYDAAKLLIESKDVVDLSTNSTINVEDIRMLSGTGFQVGGLACQTSSVYLYRKYVYIALPRFSFGIPANILSLEGFGDTFESMMTLIIEMEELASLIKKSSEFFDSDHRSFKYTPPAFTDDIFVDYSTWIAPKSIATTANATSLTYDPNCVDEYGWVQVGNEWYNVSAKIFLDEHPLHHDQENQPVLN
ncbi:hypothetical protein EDC96DRAFT_583132 [Choanephora cucurbitarum]|nr:hypothetical protein EDC96DRAFT_583132 [Choanephora cucurbitarum]